MKQLTIAQRKALDDAELVPYGDRGEMRPKSRGAVYIDQDAVPEKCRTDQTAQDATDINQLMMRFEKTGRLQELIEMGAQAAHGAFYGDFSDPVDFQEALQLSVHAQEQFNSLDAHIRNRFDNDPKKFLEFMADDKNTEEHYKLGLRIKPEEKPKETTLADINETLKKGQGRQKAQPKGGEDEE